MRENRLLSPYRRPPRPANDHDGTIFTEAPNVLWGGIVKLTNLTLNSPPEDVCKTRRLSSELFT
jgi:hypothetical protein